MSEAPLGIELALPTEAASAPQGALLDVVDLAVRCVISPNGKCHIMPRCIGGCQGADTLDAITDTPKESSDQS